MGVRERGAASVREAAHWSQNDASASSWAPHDGQAGERLALQLLQYFAPSRFSWPQDGQSNVERPQCRGGHPYCPASIAPEGEDVKAR